MKPVLLSISLLSSIFSFCQVGPPSLAVGAGKVLYEEGQIDAELVAAIISSKQDELKKELANRLILDKLQHGSFVLWYYSKESVDLLFNEKDKSIIRKEMLRNSVELMTVIAIAEYYLRFKLTNGGSFGTYDEFQKVGKISLREYLEDSDFITSRKYLKQLEYRRIVHAWLQKQNVDSRLLPDLTNNFSYGDYKDNLKKRIQPQDTEIRRILQDSKNSFLQKPSLLFEYNKLGSIPINLGWNPADPINPVTKDLLFSNILLDLVFSVCANDSYLQGLGLFQRNIDIPERKYLDNYLVLQSYHRNRNLGVSTASAISTRNTLGNLTTEFDNSKKEIRKLLEFVGDFSYMITKNNLGDFSAYATKELDNSVVLAQLKTKQKAIQQLVESLSDSDLCEDCDKSLLDDLINLSNPGTLLDTMNSFNTSYFIQEVVYPKLIKSQGNPKISIMLEEVKSLQEILLDYSQTSLIVKLRDNLNMDISDIEKIELFLKGIKDYAIRVIEIINNLDQAESYEKAGKFISGIGNLNSNLTAQKIGNSIINLNDRYITVADDSNYVQIDVESAYLDIYKTYAEKTTNRLSPYFSVGINYNIVNQKQANDTTYMLDANGIPITDVTGAMVIDTVISDLRKSTGYIGEKIGIKLKIHDFIKSNNYKSSSKSYESYKTYLRGNRTPLVTDFYTLFYVSGLLYQIDVLKTDNTFSKPLGGFGVGLAFFNNLDVNFSYTAPLQDKFSKGFWNFSFDIKITEYLSELSKKRRENKISNGE